MSQFFPAAEVGGMLMLVACACFALALLCAPLPRLGMAFLRGFWVVNLVACSLLLAGCADPINPVRYQPVEVLVTKPCFAGRTPPAEAIALTEPVCTGSDAECVRAAKADILELQREARQYRLLFKECSK